MKQLYKQKREAGFTIIEVLIVLAIAALILLIVFLAVPALQRNARNNSRNNDAAALLAAINDYVANNNGALPTNCGFVNPNVTFGTTGTNATSDAKMGYYQTNCATGVGAVSGTVYLKQSFSATAALSNSLANDWVIITPGSVCQAGGAVAGTARQITAVYQTEAGPGKFNSICRES
jgi:prepilin-type N-terminal cleavage/methylation domain-containing protein